MKIVVPGFQGQVSVVGAQRLEDSQATEAKNCLIQSGDLVPFRAPLSNTNTGSPATGTHTIFKHSSRWVRWDTEVNAVRAPVADDVNHRLYYTGDGSYPKVTDSSLIGGGYGAPSGSRRVGLPVPSTPENPSYNQAGQGTITSITLYSGTSLANSINPVIYCTAAHGLNNGDYVILDYPGIDATAYEVEIPSGSVSSFRVKGLRLKQAPFGKAIRPANVKGVYQPVRIYSQNHGFSAGDKIALYWSGSGSGNVNIAINTIYEVDYVDANSFDLIGTEANNAVEDVLKGRGRQLVVRVSAAANPFSGSGTEGNVTIGWDGSKYAVYTIPETGNDFWIKTDVASSKRDRAYLVTWVNGYGEEGAPSDPTTIISITPDTSVVFSSFPTEALNGANDYWITHMRLYRTDANGNWRYVTELAYGTQSYTDTKLDGDLGETLPTEGWYAPPDDMKGLTMMPGGCFIGFNGKTILGSKPYVPYAYPYENRVQVDQDVVGLVCTAAGVVVLTEGNPSLLIGTDPSSWAVVKLEIPQSCTNAQSIVDMGDYGLFASPDGLIAIRQNDPQVATSAIFSREQWQNYGPSTIVGSFYEGKYFGSHGFGASRSGFILNPTSGDFVEVDIPTQPVAFYNDPTTDTLYFLGFDGTIYQWDRGTTYLSFTWSSKTFQAPSPTNMGAAQVVADGTVTFKLYADDTLKHTQTVTNSDPFRLPAGYRAMDYKITLTGNKRIRMAAVAGTISELKEV